MHWYWIVCIVVGALALIVLALGAFTFHFAFGKNQRAVDKLFAAREQDPAPLVRMRYDTKAYMDALAFEPMTLLSRDGKRLSARFFPNGGTNRVAIILHGWHSFPWWDFGRSFDIVYNAGCAVLAVEQRAQGGSEGTYLTYGVKESEDLLGWIGRLSERFSGDVKIAIMGVSMGAATVLLATGKQLPEQVKCAVADCSYTSAKEEFCAAMKGRLPISRAVGELYARVLAGVRYRDAAPIEAVRRSKTPTLFVHGDKDFFVPYPMMQRLFDACAAPEKQKWTAKNAIHAEAAMTDPDGYAAVVLPWLQKHLG